MTNATFFSHCIFKENLWMLLDDFYLFGKGKVFFFKESYDIIPFEFKETFDKKNLNGIYQFFVKYPQVEMA